MLPVNNKQLKKFDQIQKSFFSFNNKKKKKRAEAVQVPDKYFCGEMLPPTGHYAQIQLKKNLSTERKKKRISTLWHN